jgi:hypothetical protein
MLPFTIAFSEVPIDDEEIPIGTAIISEFFEIILSDNDWLEFDFGADDLKSVKEMNT